MSDRSPIADPLGYPGHPITVSGVLDGADFRPGERLPRRVTRPVLAIGSNADPAQLRRKLGGDVRLEVTAVVVPDLRVVHSAHVSAPGYLPWTPLVTPGAPGRPALLLLLTPDQRRRLDATEPNYRRRPGPDGHQLYVGRWGALTDRGEPLAAGPQHRAYAALARRPWFAELVPEWAGGVAAAMRALRADPVRRDEVRRRLIHS